ncbi:MAG TPA: cytochrome c oxidase subunit 3 [Bacteroidia bacterium]|nr:cytochrome c oxidase subunit 3 [Bacteroidia bacterium]
MAEHSAEELDKYASWEGAMSPLRASYGKLFMWFFLISDALTFSGFLCSYGFFRHRYAGEWPIPSDVFHHFPFLHGVHLPLMYVGLMTFILIMSSVTMVLAVESGHRNYKKGVLIWMFLTVIGGLMFVGSQAWEWYNFIKGSDEGAVLYQNKIYKYPVDSETHHADTMKLIFKGEILSPEKTMEIKSGGEKFYGANLQHNEYGHTGFADFFFFITGFHGFHVFSGVIINLVIFIMALQGVFERRGHYEMVEKVGLYWHFVDLVWVFVFTFFYLL